MADNNNAGGFPSEPPPPYTPYAQNSQSCPPYYTTMPAPAQPATVLVDSPAKVFSKMARFDGISKPSIPPPPPGCMPNQYQLMAMQGPVQVVFGDPNHRNQPQNPR